MSLMLKNALFLLVLWPFCVTAIDLSQYPRSEYHTLEFVETLNPVADVYTLRYRNDIEYYYNHFIVTDQGVIVLDPTSDTAAAAMVEVIREIAPDKTLAAIVYSHLHTDHIAGGRVLLDELNPQAMIIAHERTDEFLRRRNFPIMRLPTHTVGDEGGTFNFGNIDLELRFLGYGHTNSVLVPIIVQRRLAYAVDFANGDVVGWTDMPGWDIDELQRMKLKLLKLDVDQIVFAHGLPGDKSTVSRQLEYYGDLRHAVTNAIEQGLDVEQTVSSVELPKYQGFWNYDDWFKDNVRGMYRYLTDL